MVDFVQRFLTEQQLPSSYRQSIDTFFTPVATHIQNAQRKLARPYFVGINGCQGSGKTTLAAYLTAWFEQQNLNAISISLDDFYYSKQHREQLADNVHPLLKTRGVPGTHDMALAKSVLSKLARGESRFLIPKFNKATDDLEPQDEWVSINAPVMNAPVMNALSVRAPVDIVVIEGWCWGANHQPVSQLAEPVNALESEQDPYCEWRHYVNESLLKRYEPLYPMMDAWLMLKAPSFDCVHQWRLEQEQKLMSKLTSTEETLSTGTSGVMSAEDISVFIQHYQRLTEHVLTELPSRADVVWQLNRDREIEAVKTKKAFTSIREVSAL